MKNIRFENRLRKMLSESSGREHVKRMLNESLNNKESECRAAYGETNWTLACSYGCIPSTGKFLTNIMIPGQQKQTVVSLDAKQPVGNYKKVLVTQPNAQTGQMTVYMSNDNASELLKNNKQGLETLWYAVKSCQDLLPSVNPQLSPEATALVQKLITLETPTGGQPKLKFWADGMNDPSSVKTGWIPIKLKDFIDSYVKADKTGRFNAIATMIEAQRESPVMMWYQAGGLSQTQAERSIGGLDAWLKATGGLWKEGPCPPGKENTCTQKNLKTDPATAANFKNSPTDVFVHMLDADATGDQIASGLTDAYNATVKNNDKETCKPLLKLYAQAYKLGVQYNPQEIEQYKKMVNLCRSRHNYLMGVDNKLFDNELQVNAIKGSTNYSLGSGATRQVQRESHRDRELKNLIRESLLDIKRTKKKINLGENKIINSRIKLISEHRTLKNKIQKDKFFGELMMEMAYLNSQGYDSQLINENFLDMLKGLFGTAADSTLQYFKESIAKWLIGTLTPMDTNGWMANIIIAAVGNVPIGEISRLTECNYLSDVLTKSIVEGAVNKYKNEQGLTGPFYDILRNGVIEMLEDTKFGQVIETAIGDLVCPLLGGIKDKMGSAAETMKKGALSLT